MIRLILSLLLLLCSLLTVLPIPAKQVWYLAIAVAEFPWVWILASLLLLSWAAVRRACRIPVLIISVVAGYLFCVPVIGAYRLSRGLDGALAAAYGQTKGPLQAPHRAVPFSALQMIGGIGAAKVAFTTHQYAAGGSEHSLNIYPSQVAGVRPCLVVVHGGSWKSGSNAELPDVNSYFAKAGYQVATINYRLAPDSHSPAPQEDVHLAFGWLRAHAAEFRIDTTSFVLMGRSAGGQIVLTAAYSAPEPGLRGVISFYGPTDMLFAWSDKHNRLVMDHQQVMRDFFGGSPDEVHQQYVAGSPVTYVTPRTVPTLLVHGMLDQHVHFRESELLAAKLQSAGVPHMLLGLPWATHGCEYSLNGPSGQLVVYTAERFLHQVTQNSVAMGSLPDQRPVAP